MKVRMLTTSAGPGGGWNAGEVLERADGEKLVKAGLAVAHKPPVPAERAVAQPQREARVKDAGKDTAR